MKPKTFFDNQTNSPIYDQANKYLAYCLNVRRMSPKTIIAKKQAIKKLITEGKCRDLRKFTNSHYDRFIEAELAHNTCNRTINCYSTHMLTFVRYWREMGMTIPLKVPLIVRLKENIPKPTFYTREEIEEVLEQCTSDLQWLLIRIPFDTGMRITELKNLSLSQITGRRIDFIGKGAREREVYLPTDTHRRLMSYVADHPEISDGIWLNEWGKKMSTDLISRIQREAFVRCGYNDFHPHALRHSFGSDIQKQGASIFVIKEMMGHSSISTTQRYLHMLDNKLADLFEKYKG